MRLITPHDRILVSSIFYFIFIFFKSFTVATIDSTIISICGGLGHACALFGDNKLKCWGMKRSWGVSLSMYDYLGDSMDELGINMPYVNIGINVSIDDVFCGSQHTCIKLSTGDMKCMGDNSDGQVGAGNATELIGEAIRMAGDQLPIINLGNELKVLSIAAGKLHTCVLSTDYHVKCFGYGPHGQLGYGDAKSRGTVASDMGNNLPYIILGSNIMIASLHSGSQSSHNCVILSAPFDSYERIKCWGLNNYYQLGYGDANTRGIKFSDMGDNLPLVDLGMESKVKQVAVGYTHTCALLVSLNMKCWGDQYFGELASGGYTMLSFTGDSLPIVPIDSGKRISSVMVSDSNTCILYDDLVTLKCAGWNYYGQLGQGDKLDRGRSPTTTYPMIPAIDLGVGSLNISSVYPGRYFNCVLFVDNSIRCFGINYYGNLAIGINENAVGDKRNEMGVNLNYAKLLGTVVPTHSPTHVPTNNPSMKNDRVTKSPTTILSESGIIALISILSVIGVIMLSCYCVCYSAKNMQKQKQPTKDSDDIDSNRATIQAQRSIIQENKRELDMQINIMNNNMNEDDTQRRQRRWNERREQLITVYKVNFPELGPDFEQLVSSLLQMFTFADVVKRIQTKDPNAIIPQIWLDDIKNGYETGMEPIPTAIVVKGINE